MAIINMEKTVYLERPDQDPTQSIDRNPQYVTLKYFGKKSISHNKHQSLSYQQLAHNQHAKQTTSDFIHSQQYSSDETTQQIVLYQFYYKLPFYKIMMKIQLFATQQGSDFYIQSLRTSPNIFMDIWDEKWKRLAFRPRPPYNQSQQFRELMSLLLLQQQQWDLFMPRPLVREVPLQSEGKIRQNYLQRVDETMKKEMGKHQVFTQTSELQDARFKRYCILFESPRYSLKGIMSFAFCKVRGELHLKIDILNHDCQYLKLENRRQVIQICRNIVLKHGYSSLQAKIMVNLLNGRLKISLPFLNHINANLLEFSSKKMKENIILNMGRYFIHECLPYLQKILRVITPPENMIQPFTSIQSNLLSKIYKYSDMLLVTSHLSESLTETQNQILSHEKNRQQSIRRLVQDNIPLPLSFIKSCSPMCSVPEFIELASALEQFQITQNEMIMIRSMIVMPYQPKSANPYENSLILNHILIQEPTKLHLTRIKQGGFSKILMGEIKFWYLQSYDEKQPINKKQVCCTKTMIRKYAVVKIQEAATAQGKINRTQHQINILKNIKNGSSIFLSKYYIPVNQPAPFSNGLILDYIPFNDLGEFLRISRETLSLNSKLYLMFSIVQSLRYLRDYQIVHLDIKPNNIMIYCNMLIKLIDFGESYHPNVCKNSHKPGYTFPYSCPQMFQQTAPKFTYKSDVFSIGVLFYQMIYGQYPFQIKINSNKKIQMQKYLDYWYFTPEEYQRFGNAIILRIINNILSKCLSVDPNQRPQLDWLAVTIRLCFEFML